MQDRDKMKQKCSICGADYEERCIHNPSNVFIPDENGFVDVVEG
jgi:hypothetical protein